MFGDSDRRSDITARILTPLSVTRKTPVTARTAGRCDRPEAPTAPPAFILLFFSSSVKSPEGKCPLSKEGETAAQNRPESAWRGRGLAPSAIGAHRGSHGQTQGAERPWRVRIPLRPHSPDTGANGAARRLLPQGLLFVTPSYFLRRAFPHFFLLFGLCP